MSTLAPELPAERPESFGDDLAGMGSFFIDPNGAARHVFKKWFWVGPLIVVSVVSLIGGYLTLPIVQHVLEVTPPPPNVTPEQYQKGVDIGMMVQRILMYCAPVVAGVIYAIEALILLGMSAAMSVTTKFRWLFNLVAGCALISLLARIATVVILKAKGEVSTTAELQPPLGLDIFMPEGANKIATGFLGYFSVFEIWWIVMMVLIFSTAFRTSKGKAFMAVLPLILLSILFRVVGAAFQK